MSKVKKEFSVGDKVKFTSQFWWSYGGYLKTLYKDKVLTVVEKKLGRNVVENSSGMKISLVPDFHLEPAN